MKPHHIQISADRRLAASGLLGLLLALAACTGAEKIEDKPIETPVEEKPEVVEEPTLPPVPQELIDQSGVQEFEVSGLHVILKPTPGKPVVSVDLYIDGGLVHATEGDVGLERLALASAVSGGTTAHPRDAFNATLNSMGAHIHSNAEQGFSSISAGCVRPYFDETWGLFAEVLTAPAFDAEEFERIKVRTVESIKAVEEDPDDYVGDLANQLHFKGHPYAMKTLGTVENVQGFTIEQAKTYYADLLKRRSLLLVVVGDVDRPTLEKAIAKLGPLAEGQRAVVATPVVAPHPAAIQFAEKELPTNYLFGFFSAPPPTHPDYYPMLVATTILRDRLFEEVRTKRNLTYAVSAGLSRRRSNIGYLYVTTVKPNDVIAVMKTEIDKLANEPVDDKTLKDLVEGFLTRYYLGQESNDAQGASLASNELLAGGWERSLVFIDAIKAVKPEDIARVVKAYFHGVHWGYVGKPEAADEAVLKSL